jgi:hypothetical protein
MRRRQPVRVLLAAFAFTVAPRVATSKERVAVVFYTAETNGTLEPCGCTSDPLGDFARVSALVRKTNAGRGRALLVDAGNLTYPATESPARRQPVDDLKARFLASELAKLPWGGSALGDSDLARGVRGIVPKRLAVNVPAGVAADVVAPSSVMEVGGIKIGVLGLAAPGTAATLGTTLMDPEASAKDEVKRLRERGAEVVILLAPVERPMARALARASGADFVVVGKKVGLGMRRAEPAGTGFVVAAGEALQYLGRLDIVLREGPSPTHGPALVDAGGEAATHDRVDEIDRMLTRLDKDIAGWQKETSADAAFVAGKIRERDELRAERTRLTDHRWRPPAQGSYFTNTLVPVRRTLPRDPALRKSMRALDEAIGEVNLKMAEPPPKPEPGRAFYVGGERCISCHKAAQRSWLTTAHAKAWKTLVDVGKDAHDDCVSCHVTGYGEVGGSSLGFTKDLEDVQCEACHAPNSIHVEKKGKESPYAGVTKTPETMCVHCHNEKHSDTFQYEAYLRDALGPGHGEDLLDKLGPGPTARQLRKQAAMRAARAVGGRRARPHP